MEIKTKNKTVKIGPGYPVFVIAEMSGNHNQSFERASEIMRAAKEAGADAIKLQTYTADTITVDSDKPPFRVGEGDRPDLWKGKTLYELYREAFTPRDWHPKLKKLADELGLILFSSPFDETAVDFLEQMKVPCYKIASFEVVDIPLLKRVGQTGKPVIMSRGMASVEEVELAIKTLKGSGTPDIAILHCVSAYPARPEDMNLRTIPDIAERFGVVAGLSDHTLEFEVAIASVALGAKIIEKHITLDRSDGGVDASFSLNPDEFKNLVDSVRVVERSLGKPTYDLSGKGEEGEKKFRKSLFVVLRIKKGEEFTKKNIRSIRPGAGLAPKHYDDVLGKSATQDIERATPLSWDLIQE